MRGSIARLWGPRPALKAGDFSQRVIIFKDLLAGLALSSHGSCAHLTHPPAMPEAFAADLVSAFFRAGAEGGASQFLVADSAPEGRGWYHEAVSVLIGDDDIAETLVGIGGAGLEACQALESIG